MRIVMVSNYLNHHQLPLCRAFCAMPDVEFTFVATMPIEQERLQMGYEDMNHAYPFSLCAYDSPELECQALDLCHNCDVLIAGSAPDCYVNGRNRTDRITFFYSERLFKERGFSWKTIPRYLKYRLKRPLFQGSYLLCSSAFCAGDYQKTGNFKGRAYKWGYFPEVKRLDIDAVLAPKEVSSPTILWVGRMIDWKHPEAAILTAKRLKEAGYQFSLDMIGSGDRMPTLQTMIQEYQLQDQVRLLGNMSPQQVREHMEQANIFLFTSDRGEGWGAVLNEAMNSGCAVVAANQIGSVPYLLQHGKNGLVFQSEHWDDLYKKTKQLMDHKELRLSCGREAYQTMIRFWNGECAAQRLVQLAQHLRQNRTSPFEDGPCSPA